MKNALTVDLEDWYQTQDFNFDVKRWTSFECRIEYSSGLLLDILTSHNVRATFFVLGYVAERHPHLVRNIHEYGHEIGSHSLCHQMVNNLEEMSCIQSTCLKI